MRGVLFSLLVSFSSALFSQTLLVEDFIYPSGDSLTSHGWIAYGAAGINPILVHSPGLDYPGHPGSGVGNAARLSGTGEDVRRSFQAQSDKTVYVSFLVNVQNATSGTVDKHFLHLNTNPQIGRVYARRTSGSIAFGLEHGSEGPVFTGDVYAMNVVYLIVLRYDHISGAANDAVRLYVFGSGVPSVEPAVPTLGPSRTSGSEPSSLSSVSLRQADSPDNDVLIDAIRVGVSWSEAGLPVELSHFGATTTRGLVELVWKTESEVGNYGFEVERRVVRDGNRRMDDGSNRTVNESTNRQSSDQNHRVFLALQDSPWRTVGFVQGAGTSSVPREYSFVDRPDEPGCHAYRLKQIDFDGAVRWSGEVIVDVEQVPEGIIMRCYPNPFNGITTFSLQLPERGRVTLRVYDVTGKSVALLLDEERAPGVHRIPWLGGTTASGVYYAVVEMGVWKHVERVVLVR